MSSVAKPRLRARVKLTKNGIRRGYEKWVDVGVAFVLPSGQINVVLDTMPVVVGQWDGTIALFPVEQAEEEDVERAD